MALNYAFIERTRPFDLVEANRRDKDYMEAAVKDAKSTRSTTPGNRRPQVELDKLGKQRDAIMPDQKLVEAKLADVTKVDRLSDRLDNRSKAAELTKLELEAGRRIDAQTRTMVQLEPSAVH